MAEARDWQHVLASERWGTSAVEGLCASRGADELACHTYSIAALFCEAAGGVHPMATLREPRLHPRYLCALYACDVGTELRKVAVRRPRLRLVAVLKEDFTHQDCALVMWNHLTHKVNYVVARNRDGHGLVHLAVGGNEVKARRRRHVATAHCHVL
eukprot:3972264-Prymnesium_polylepis.2